MYNLLILDDEPLFRQYTRSVIDWQELGFEVFEADNGKAGIDIVKSRDIALVFADINMPIMDGIEFGKIAKKIKPDIYIVIVSRYGEFEFTKKAIKIGVNANSGTLRIALDEVEAGGVSDPRNETTPRH